MDFKPVDPRTIPNRSGGHRGRVSYPLLKSFMESKLPAAQIDRSGMQQSLMALRSSLTAYIGSHDLPIYVFQRDGELYLARLDMEMDEEGVIHDVPNWRELRLQASRGMDRGTRANDTPQPMSMDEVNARYEEEKGNVTA